MASIESVRSANDKGVRVPVSLINPNLRTAENLDAIVLKDNWFHNNIAITARALVENGQGNMTYLTQYTDGSILWDNEDRPFGGVIAKIEHFAGNMRVKISPTSDDLRIDYVDLEKVGDI